MQKRQTLLNECWFLRDVAASWPRTAAAHLPLVVRTDVVTAQEADVPNQHEDFFAVYIVRRGRGTHVINGIPYGVSRGDVYVMGLGVTHLYSQYEDLALDALYFSPAIFDAPTLEALGETAGFLSLFVEAPLRRMQETSGSGRWLHLAPAAYETVAEMLGELRAEWAAGTASGTLLTRGLFLRLLVHLARRYADSQAATTLTCAPPSGLRETTVAAAVRYMDEHFAEPLRMEQIAASVFLSADRFTEVFSRVMGRTPRDYLRHLRLERAKSLLTATDEPVALIGLQAGYGDAAYFTRTFRAASGMTPREYRRAGRSGA